MLYGGLTKSSPSPHYQKNFENMRLRSFAKLPQSRFMPYGAIDPNTVELPAWLCGYASVNAPSFDPHTGFTPSSYRSAVIARSPRCGSY
jgi:hypothetical protein